MTLTGATGGFPVFATGGAFPHRGHFLATPESRASRAYAERPGGLPAVVGEGSVAATFAGHSAPPLAQDSRVERDRHAVTKVGTARLQVESRKGGA